MLISNRRIRELGGKKSLTMKERLFLLMAAILLTFGVADAKPKKINYGKFVYYEGEVVNKQPMGNGRLVLLSPTNKKERVLTITGRFDSESIYNAEISSSMLPTIKTVGYNPIKFSPRGISGKVKNLVLDFSDVSFLDNSKEYAFNGLVVTFSIVDKVWKMDLNSYPQLPIERMAISNNFFVTTKGIPVPEKIVKFWNIPNNVWCNFKFSDGKIQIDSPILYEFNDFIYDCNSGHFIHNMENVIFNPDLYFEILNDHTWRGIRIINDGLESDVAIIYCVNDSVSIFKHNDIIYEGTLIDPMQPVYQSFNSISKLKYRTGALRKDGRTVKIINGESEDKIRTRLEQSNIEKDLIEGVLNGEISETDAFATQQQRNDEKERLLKEENEKLAAILKSKWNCEQIGFSGPIIGTEEGDQVLRMILNIDHTFFSGEVLLALQSDGEAIFGIVAKPADKVGRMGRGRAMQVLDACEKINKKIQGRWSMNGNDILINGEKVAALSADGKTVIYEGMVGAKMKIIKKL